MLRYQFIVYLNELAAILDQGYCLGFAILWARASIDANAGKM